MSKRVEIDLTPDDRQALQQLTRKGQTSARKLNRARILLLVDEGRAESDISRILGSSGNTIWRTKKRYNEGGLDWALNDEPRAGAPPKLDGKQEALLVALACSDPPEGRETWTMQLLADKLVELDVVTSISDETVRTTLKKTTLSRGKTSLVHPKCEQ
jgi:transposase